VRTLVKTPLAVSLILSPASPCTTYSLLSELSYCLTAVLPPEYRTVTAPAPSLYTLVADSTSVDSKFSMHDQASLAAMSGQVYRAKVESGEIPVDSHALVLRIAYIYVETEMGGGNGVFDVVDLLHARGWSFGEGNLKFNRYVCRPNSNYSMGKTDK
jgi:hypothetical protein